MENKKYELVEDDFIIHKGKRLYRIKALKKFHVFGSYTVQKGDLGGYVEGYHNLSQEGNCWICDVAKVYGNARVKDYASVGGIAEIYDNASIENGAAVGNSTVVFGNAVVKGSARVIDYARISGNAVIKDDAKIGWCAKVYDNAVVKANITYNNKICGNTEVCRRVSSIHDEEISGNSKLE